MSYIPPHKRHRKDPVRPSPVPDSINRQMIIQEIVYSRDFIGRWFLTGSDKTENNVKLVPFSSDSAEYKNGEKPLVLLKNNLQKGKITVYIRAIADKKKDVLRALISLNVEESKEKSEWMLVAEKLEDALVLAVDIAKKKQMKYYHPHVDNATLKLVARFGKLLFYGQEAGDVSQCLLTKTSKWMLYTNVSTSFLQNIKSKLVPNYKFCVDKEKDTYIAKIAHFQSPTDIMNCKCILKEDGLLSMYKTEFSPIGHLLVDVSCLVKNPDMRLMLSTKSKLMALTEKETSNIKEIVQSVGMYPNVKGGLEWSVGKALSKDGYCVVGVDRIIATTYENQTLRLIVKEADRYSVRSGRRKVKREVNLILKGINTQLQEDNVDRSCVSEMLRDALQTIWDLLSCDDA